jgi:hypothetical protein
MRAQSGQRFIGADSRAPGSPFSFRAKRVGRIFQGKPWAKLSWPLRATDWKRPSFDCRSLTLSAIHLGRVFL